MGSFDDLIPGGSSQGGSGAFDDLIPKKSSLARRVLGDTGVSALKGAVGLTEVPVGIADILTGGNAGKALEGIGYRPKEAKAALDEYFSPEQKAANQYVQEGDGFLDTVKRGLSRPSVIAQSVVESLPLLLPGAAAARGIGAATKAAPYIAGAAGEGLVGAGSAAEQLRQGSEDGAISGKQTLGALASGVGTAGFGALGGKVASSAIGKKLGISDIDTVLAGGASNPASVGLAKRALSGAVSEGVLEELPQSMWEQAAQNYATDKPLGEGVGQAGAMGLLAGTAMGGTFNAMQRGEQRKEVDDTKPVAEEVAPVADGLTFQPGLIPGVDVGEPKQATIPASDMPVVDFQKSPVYGPAAPVSRADGMQGIDFTTEPKLQETGPMSSAVNVGVDSGATSLRPQGSFSDMSEFANLLGQEQQDVQSRRTGIAGRQALQREVALRDADQRVADQMAKEAAQRRRAVLDQVLSDPTTQNPADRFAAELQRQGFRDSTPTADELATVQRFNDIKAAQPAGPEIEPSLPNEVDAEQLGIRSRKGSSGAQSSGRDKVAEVRQLVADGWKISNKTLVSPTGKKRILNTAEHAAAKEATRERNLAAMERYRQSKGKGTPVSTTNVASEETNAPEIEQLAPQAPQANDAQVEPQPSAAPQAKVTPVKVETQLGNQHPDYNKGYVNPVLSAFKNGNFKKVTIKSGREVNLVLGEDKYGDDGVVSAVSNDGEIVGSLYYVKSQEGFNPDVHVNDGWRRLGIASAMYDLAESTGGKIPAINGKTGQLRTEDGQKFRQAREAKKNSVQTEAAPAAAQSDVEDYGKRVVRRNKPVSKWTAEEIQDRLARADSGESPISDESRSQLQAALEPLVAANKEKEAKAAEQAERVKKMQAAKAANKDTFQIGENKDSLERVSVRNGVVHLGDYPATDYDSGDEITVPDGATKQQVLDALIAGEAVTKKAKVWGKNGPEQSVADRIAELQAERDAMTKSEQRAAEAIQSAMEVAAGEGVAEAEVMAELGAKNEEVGQAERSNQESQVGNDVGSQKPARSGDEERDGDAQGQEREVIEPQAKDYTPKQFHEAKLKYIANSNGVSMVEVREMYDTDAGRKESEREWVDQIRQEFKIGNQLSRQMLDKLEEVRPGAVSSFAHDYPESKIPNGYQIPSARKIEQNKQDERKADRKAVKGEREVAADGRVSSEAKQSKQDDKGAANFSFAGRSAATADQFALSNAEKRIEAGDDAEEVRKETGWFKGADGKWRFEIDDSDAKLIAKNKWADLFIGYKNKDDDSFIELGSLLHHPSLFAAYPRLVSLPITIGDGGGASFHQGGYGDGYISIGAMASNRLSTLLHEIQHGIQSIEGFAMGGSQNQFAESNSPLPSEIKNRIKAVSDVGRLANEFGTTFKKVLKSGAIDEPMSSSILAGYTNEKNFAAMVKYANDRLLSPEQKYRLLAGEAEARNVQSRQSMTAEQRRERSPASTQDVSDSDVIVIFNGKVMQDVPMPANASRGQGNGMAFRDLQAVVDRVSKGFNNLPKIHVLDSPRDLSDRRDNERTLKEQIEQAGAMDDVEGAHHNGEIYLFASGIASEERAEHVLATHEITHYGLRGTMGKGLDSALQNIWLYNKEVRAKAAVLRMQLGLTSNVSAVEEVLAEMKDSDLVKLKGWRKMVQAFRDWAHKAGFDRIAEKLDGLITKGMSDQEKADLFVANMVNAARDWVRNGKPARGYDPGTSMLGDANFSAKKSDVTDTPAFRKWFGNSKVVDADGRPIVVYHSSNANNIEVFSGSGVFGQGPIYFNENEKAAKKAARGSKVVYQAFLRMSNPANTPETALPWHKVDDGIWVAQAKRNGYDGVYVKDEGGVSIAVFGPTQIKSAIGNNGNFDASNPDIRFSRNKSASVDASITEIFDGLAGRGLRKVRAEERLAEHPQAESIRYIQDNILDILEELEGAGTIKINC